MGPRSAGQREKDTRHLRCHRGWVMVEYQRLLSHSSAFTSQPRLTVLAQLQKTGESAILQRLPGGSATVSCCQPPWFIKTALCPCVFEPHKIRRLSCLFAGCRAAALVSVQAFRASTCPESRVSIKASCTKFCPLVTEVSCCVVFRCALRNAPWYVVMCLFAVVHDMFVFFHLDQFRQPPPDTSVALQVMRHQAAAPSRITVVGCHAGEG